MTAVVTESFVEGGWWNETNAAIAFASAANSTAYGAPIEGGNNTKIAVKVLKQLQSHILNLTRLENIDCENTFGSGHLDQPYLNVLLITNYTSKDSLVVGSIHNPERGTDDIPWFNATGKDTTLPLPFDSLADWYAPTINNSNGYVYSHGANWSLPVITGKCNNNNCSTEPAWVQYCLAQPVGRLEATCTISISVNLLIAVIACNGVKVACLLAILLAPGFHPFATVGDAISSFMSRPDSSTLTWGPVSTFDLIQISSKDSCIFGTSGWPLSFSTIRKHLTRSISCASSLRTSAPLIHIWKHQPRKWSTLLSSPFPLCALCL